MDRRKRAVLCILMQLAASWCMFLTDRALRTPEIAAALAEEEMPAFLVEVIAESLTPAPAVTPLPSETPTGLPEATMEPAATPASTPAPMVDTGFCVEVIRETASPQPWTDKRILIYHTHTWEAYEQTPSAPYQETERWRTKDASCNVTAVGSALAAQLRALGLVVTHDTTAFEPPNLDGAYDRSLAMLEERRQAGETYDLYIDLHRDALSSQSTIRRTVMIGGAESARFMVLIGQGITGGYVEKPDWEENLALAERITAGLNRQCAGIARDVKIKTGRFNQHVSDCCVLIECGVNTNTLEQVLTGIPYLAQAIAEALAE